MTLEPGSYVANLAITFSRKSPSDLATLVANLNS
jgi:hypothetical protein